MAVTHDVACNQFFKILMAEKLPEAFKLFSKHTQDIFLQWSLDYTYQRNPDAAKQAELTLKEIRVMFLSNHLSIRKSFWRHYAGISGALEIFRFGYFSPGPVVGNVGEVHVNLQYPDGRKGKVSLKMIKEGGQWRFGYIESGLRWP
jgi:IS5 family transposase